MLQIPKLEGDDFIGWERIHNFPNVLMVKDIVSEEIWNNFFPNRKELFKYDHFLRAVAQFPAFCTEYNNVHANLDSYTSACKRELATLFAHITYESGHYYE